MTSATPVATRIQVNAIGAVVLAQLLERDDAGHPPRITDTEVGSPLRCCLRRIQPGEQVALVSYAPLRRWARQAAADPGPFDELGPIFIHPDPCAGPAQAGLPPYLSSQHWMLRAYQADGRIRGGRLVTTAESADPTAAAAIVAAQFDDPAVAVLHARAVEFGCFQFEITR
jgi:Protein of unknown function (DUF1203)